MNIENVEGCELDIDKLSSYLLLLKTDNKFEEYYSFLEEVIEDGLESITDFIDVNDSYDILVMLAECMINLSKDPQDNYITMLEYVDGEDCYVVIHFCLDNDNKIKIFVDSEEKAMVRYVYGKDKVLIREVKNNE